MCSPYRPSNSSFYWIRKRVPEDVRQLAGKREIKKSLRTRDPQQARKLAPQACSEIDRYISELRRSLQMNSDDLKALTGEYFRSRLSQLIEQARKESWEEKGFEIESSKTLESIEPDTRLGLSMEEWREHRRDSAKRWGLKAATPILQRHNLTPPPLFSERLGLEVFKAELKAYQGAYAEVVGDADWEPPQFADERLKSRDTLMDLWEGYSKSSRNAGTAIKTLEGWKSNIRKASTYLNHKPAASISKQDIRSFAEALRSHDPKASPAGKRLTAKTVNDNYLASLSALFKWAVDSDILKSDPTRGVSVRASAADSSSIEAYTREEIATLLRATRQPRSKRVLPEHAAVSRWVPWLCAFTGARISEILSLKQSDIGKTDGVTYIDIREGKTRDSIRSVPLHPAIVTEGFLEYVSSLNHKQVYVFPGPWEDQYGDRTKTPANKLRTWIKKQLTGADWSRLSPNHSFRHWLTQECRRASIDGDLQRVITGHKAKDIHGTYGRGDTPVLYEALVKIPSPLDI